jgi:hypothetical protein
MQQDREAGTRPTVADHVKHFLDDVASTSEMKRELLWRLLDAVKEVQKAIKRDLILLAILVFAFELINRKLVGEASAAGIKLSKLEFLRYVIPVALAYIFLRIMITSQHGGALKDAYLRFSEGSFPGLRRSALDVLLAPGPLPLSAQTPDEYLSGKFVKVLNLIDLTESVLFVYVLPVGFTVYAATQLFRSSATPHIGAVLTSISTVSLLAVSYVVIAKGD